MVNTFGSNIVSAFTGGSSVIAIYNNGIKVWPEEPTTYYIRWAPSYISSGTFSIGGSTYNFRDYSNGEFTFSTGVITDKAFQNTIISTVETNALYIGWHAFYNCQNLTYASLSNCREIDSYAFQSCSSLSRTSIPRCITVGQAAFYDCRRLEGMYLPNCLTIGGGAFYWCDNYFSFLSAPECTSIGGMVFYGDKQIRVVELPKVRYYTGGTFGGNNLSSVIFRYHGYISGPDSTHHAAFAYPTIVYVQQQWVDDYVDDSAWEGQFSAIPSDPGWPYISYPSWIYD